MRPRLDAKVGDQLTLTTIQGQTLTGHVVFIDAEEDGGIVKLALEEPARDDPVWVRGDLIAMWRFGAPVVAQVPMMGPGGLQQVPLSPEMLRQLRGG